MSQIDPDSVFDALRHSLGRITKSAAHDELPLSMDRNLLDLVDSAEFAWLIEDLEASLDLVLPLDQVDMASIAHIDRLITFICEHG